MTKYDVEEKDKITDNNNNYSRTNSSSSSDSIDNTSDETTSLTDQNDEIQNNLNNNLLNANNINNIISNSSNKLAENNGIIVKKKKRNEDIGNICFLLFLYVLQGIPSGLSFSIPLILSSRKVSYADQGTFSFASWPFSMKILWAPLVDSIYSKRIGRRKSWLVVSLFLTGIIMVSFSSYANQLLDSKRVKQPQDIYILTVIFGIIVALVTTQDVVIDGWSLDLLLKYVN
jgi:hypothetical protein